MISSPLISDNDTVAIVRLPFEFERLRDGRVAVVSAAGDWLLLEVEEFEQLVTKNELRVSLAKRLASTHIVRYLDSKTPHELLKLKLATRYRDIMAGASLHIFVVTLRCEHSCAYCQVSRKNSASKDFDMSERDALAALKIVFASPSESLKIEFQGGESLLNFDLIKFIVLQAKEMNRRSNKNLQFVIATNLVPISEEILDFAEEHEVFFSTSIDGPKELHNKDRHRPGLDSWEQATAGISRVRARLGQDSVAALMTTTKLSLQYPEQIVDEYVGLGFREVFLRQLSPYGFAMRGRSYSSYDHKEWMQFYKRGLHHIINLNRGGTEVVELMASLYLKKLLTNENGGYVDLTTPSGCGLGALIYNYDGFVYASDEGRMLKEMGDERFNLGHVTSATYEELLSSDHFVEMIEESFAPSNPMCSDCALKPFCGSDPVFHYATQGNYVGHKTESSFCKRTKEIVPLLMQLYVDDDFCRQLFDRWANQ